MTPIEQKKATSTCIRYALLLLKHGEDADAIEESVLALAQAVGLQHIDVTILTNTVILTSLINGRHYTISRKAQKTEINNAAISELLLMAKVAADSKLEIKDIDTKLRNFKAIKYHNNLLILGAAISTTSYAALAFNVSLAETILIFITTCATTFCWLSLQKIHLNIVVNYAVTAFLSVLLAGLLRFFPPFTHATELVFFVNLLPLIPIYFFVSAISNSVKGQITVGINYLVLTLMMILAIIVGIMLAFQIITMF